MSPTDLPSFITKGTFSWGALDYHYQNGPPAGFDSPEALESADPWIVLAATLECAKRGNHEPIGQLGQLVSADNQNPLVTNVALELIGTAGTRDQLWLLEDFIRDGEDYLAAEACGAASCAGSLTLVPTMLAAWTRTKSFRHRQSISLRLGLLLEEWDGPITSMEPSYDESDDDLVEEDPEKEIFATESVYVEIVETALAELRTRCGRDDSPVILGQPFGVVSLAEYMLALVKSDVDLSALGSMFLFLRHRFDASTGIDCSSFFEERKFQPLAAAAILEEFLKSGKAAEFKPEVRYFFGHQIPD